MTNKQYRQLCMEIRNSLSKEDAEYLITYLYEVKNELRSNDFYDIDILINMIKIFTTNILDINNIDVKEIFEEMIKKVELLLPFGTKTPNYEEIKQLIIGGKGLINRELYVLFENKYNYYQIINLIYDHDKVKRRLITDFAQEIAPFCDNDEELKKQIVSYISEIYEEKLASNCEHIANIKIDEAKRKNGIYSLDEKTLSKLDSMVRKAEYYSNKFDMMEKRVEEYQNSINSISNTKIEEINNIVNNAKDTLIRELNNYLEELKIMMKNNSDQVFNEILLRAEDKINKIKLAAYNINNTTTSELLRIQKKTEESIDKLHNFIENDEELQKALLNANQNETITKTILKEEVVPSVQGVYVAGNNRLVIPNEPDIVIPSSVNNNVLKSFDENIPFSQREEEILKEKERREKEEGIIYHELTNEIIKCVIEGDWPYIYGPSGCGKTYLIEQIASLLGIDIAENGKITEKYSIMGYNDAHGRFKATQAFMALVYGKLLSLDEFDNGNSDTQVVLNELYSSLLSKINNPNKEKYVTFAEDMKVPVNINFRMISAGNTDGQGKNEVYQARGKIDESVQQRMTPIMFTYDNKIEKKILGNNVNWYNIFTFFRQVCDSYAKECDLSSTPGMVTTRDASAIKKYLNHNSKSVDQIIREKFVQVKEENYLDYIINKFSNKYNIDPKIYTNPIDEKENASNVDEITLARCLIYGCNNRKKRLENNES